MEGETVGSYRIVRKLGEGGMGVVYLAEHPLIGQKAAIKFLLPELSRNTEVVNRFFNEARAAAMIKHPGIIKISDFGYHASGSAYIVMEFLEGESLAGRLRRTGGRLGHDDLLRISRQIASTLAAAHAEGVVHRDLKPDNVFLVPDPDFTGGERVKILDFGIAKLGGEIAAGSIKTRTGSVMGSPAYMSPEQCRGLTQIDERSDVYALGCVMYEMCCGRTPFEGEGVGDVLAKHIYEPPPPPRELEPSVAPAVEQMVLRALAKKPEERFASMTELVHALDGAGSARFATGPAAPLPVRVPSAAAPHDVTIAARQASTTLGSAAVAVSATTTSSAGRRGWMLGMALVAVAGIGTAVFYVATRGDKDREPPAVAAVMPPPDATRSPPAPDARPAVEPRKLQLTITSEPTGAEVWSTLTGALAGTTPFTDEFEPYEPQPVSTFEQGLGHLPVGLAVLVKEGVQYPHYAFVVKHAGYEDAHVTFPADRDGSQALTLARVVAKPATSKRDPKREPKREPKQERKVPKGAPVNPFDE